MKYTVRVEYENGYKNYECGDWEENGDYIFLYKNPSDRGIEPTHIINLAKTTDVEFILNESD